MKFGRRSLAAVLTLLLCLSFALPVMARAEALAAPAEDREITPGDAEKVVSFSLYYFKEMGTHSETIGRQAKASGGPALFGHSGLIEGVNILSGDLAAARALTGDVYDRFMADYWAAHTFEGYVFQGWYNDPVAGSLMKYDSPVSQGAIYYARWAKAPDPQDPVITPGDATKPDTPDKPETPEDPVLNGISFVGTDFTRLRAHTDGSQSVTVQVSDPGAKFDLLTWNVYIYPVDDSAKIEDVLTGKNMNPLVLTYVDKGKAVTEESTGITIRSSDDEKTLTVTSGRGAEAVVMIAATAQAGSASFRTPVNAQISFSHQWEKTGGQEPSCTADGFATYKCGHPGCGETKRVTLKALGHAFNKVEILSQGSEETKAAWSKTCGRCGVVVEVEALSGNDLVDGNHGKTVNEVLYLFGGNSEGINVYVRDREGNWLDAPHDYNTYVGTGFSVRVRSYYGRQVDFPIVLPGDLNGDGLIDKTDAQQIADALFSGELTGDLAEAAKVDGGSSVTAGDVVAVLDRIPG